MLKSKSYLYEVPICFLIFYGINVIFLPEIPAYIGISPHPFWLGILLFSFRYGTYPGVLSGIIAAAIYLAQNFFEGERYLFEDLGFYLLPSLFIVCGALAGAGVARYLKTINSFKLENNLLTLSKKEIQTELDSEKKQYIILGMRSFMQEFSQILFLTNAN